MTKKKKPFRYYSPQGRMGTHEEASEFMKQIKKDIEKYKKKHKL
jgi:hypothetical protein